MYSTMPAPSTSHHLPSLYKEQRDPIMTSLGLKYGIGYMHSMAFLPPSMPSSDHAKFMLISHRFVTAATFSQLISGAEFFVFSHWFTMDDVTHHPATRLPLLYSVQSQPPSSTLRMHCSCKLTERERGFMAKEKIQSLYCHKLCITEV